MPRGSFTKGTTPPRRMGIVGSEQQKAIWSVLDTKQEHLIVDALAGAGKTTTGVEWCKKQSEGKIAYVAFNKHNATELQSLLNGNSAVEAMTYHSLGLRIIRKSLGRVDVNQYKADEILEGITFPIGDECREKTAKYRIRHLAGLAKQYGMSPTSDKGEFEYLADHHALDLEGVEDIVYEYTPILMKKCMDELKSVDFDDMIWLPHQLSMRGTKYDIMFIDEAQDTNLSQQWIAITSANRLVVIGDKHQCHPPGTLIAEVGGTFKPIEDVKIGDELISYNTHESAFYGVARKGRKVVAIHHQHYSGPLIRFSAGGFETAVTTNHRCLVRMKEKNCYLLYLMKAGNKARIGIAKGFYHCAGGSSSGLAARARSEKAESAWLLAIYPTLNDARIAELITQTKYGLPSLIFKNNMQKAIPQDFIDEVYGELGNLSERVNKCLRDFGRDPLYPFWSANEINQHVGKYSFVTAACNLISDYMEMKPYFGQSQDSAWYPIQVEREPYLGEVYGITVEPIEGDRRLYVADGIVVHNSIYGFRGSDHKSMSRIREGLSRDYRGVIELPLTITRRCPKSHVRLAQRIVPSIEALPDAPEGVIRHVSTRESVEEMAPGDLVVCRVNAELVGTAYKLLKRGVRAVVRGRDIGKGLDKLIERSIKREQLCGQDGVEQLIMTAGDITGEDVTRFRAIPQGKGNIRAALAEDKYECLTTLSSDVKTVAEMQGVIKRLFADFNDDGKPNESVVLGTVHRTKGLESERVWVLRPELMPHPMARQEWERDQEYNLAYVCVTRSKRELCFVGGESPLFVDGGETNG